MLDAIDMKVLAALEQDARMPLTQIAKNARVSVQLAKFRVARLEERKIIGGYFITVDIAKLGYTSYRILVPLMNTDKTKHKKIIEFISKRPNILWLVTCGGRYDIIFNIMARNPPHLEKQLREIMNSFPEQIQNYTIAATLSAHIFGRKFLYMKNPADYKEHYFGEEKKVIKLNEIDDKIMRILSVNARASAANIAVELNISANTVVNRIKNLKKTGLIQGFKPLLHLENMGYQSHKILIKLHKRDIEREKALFNWCKMHKDVTYFLKMISSWDLEIEPEFSSPEALQSFILDLRDRFSDIIKDIEIIPLYHDYLYNYYPTD